MSTVILSGLPAGTLPSNMRGVEVRVADDDRRLFGL